MASNDIILAVGAAAMAVVAYMGNVGAFRTWADSLGGGGAGPIGGLITQGNCTSDSKGNYCWSSSACGKPCKICAADIKGGCGEMRSFFLRTATKVCAGCKQQQQPPTGTSSTCPYTGCGHIHADPSACYTCRCQNICRSYPNTMIDVSANGSCRCVKRSALAQAFAYEGFDNVTVS